MTLRSAVDDAVAELAGRQHGAFTLAQLGAAANPQLAARRVRSRAWLRFERGTYLLPAACDEWAELAALCLDVPAASVTGRCAGQWWRFDGVDGQAVPEALVPSRCGARRPSLRRCDDVLAWEVRSEPAGCLRFTDPTRTLIELGRVLPVDALERAVESALRRHATTLPRFRTRAEQLRVRGRRGPTMVLQVLERRPVDGIADSDGEVLLLQLLRNVGLAAPVRQHQIGRWRFDLAWPEVRIAIELDGAHHRAPARLALDDRKQNEATLAGWLVLRFTWDRIVAEPHRVVEEVGAALAARGCRSPDARCRWVTSRGAPGPIQRQFTS